MFFVVDKSWLQQVIAIVCDDSSPASRAADALFVRLEAINGELSVSGTTVPATVHEPGVLFLRTTLFRRMLATFTGEKHFTIQVIDGQLLMGNVKQPCAAADMVLFPDPKRAPPRWPLSKQEAEERSIRREFGWAIDIIHKQFNSGLKHICNEDFLNERYHEFHLKQDPIYADLLNGMEDEALAKTFVSYWAIAHTIATQSRFWLETAVAEILIHECRGDEDAAKHTYVLNRGLLGALPPYGLRELRGCVTVAAMGEECLEHLSSHQVWRPVLDAHALETIDVLVGQQEREPVEERKPFQKRTWTDTQNHKARDTDREYLKAVAGSFEGKRTDEVNIQCNLLVIEPYKVDKQIHAWAFRFVNPKTIASHAQRKQERVNLLRLYALLVQEKIIRDPKSIHVCVAELVPRLTDFDDRDRYPDYFSPETYWATDRLWDFIGVPFDSVTLAIRDAAKQFREQLINGLRGLLPSDETAGSLFKNSRRDT